MISQERLTEIRNELLKSQSEITTALRTEKTRKRAALNLRLHEIRQMITPTYGFMSQAGQMRLWIATLSAKWAVRLWILVAMTV